MASNNRSSNNKKAVDTLTAIDGALCVIENFPDEYELKGEYSFSANPLDVFLAILKRTKGYDFVLKYVSEFIAYELPIIETAVKAILINHVSNMFTCAGNPIITEELLKKGFTVDLKKIDLMNILSYSPLDSKGEWQYTLNTAVPSQEFNVGKYYYFGCDHIEYIHDLRMAGDFNAFLWYVKNKSLQREVWMGVNILDATVSDSNINLAGVRHKAFANSYKTTTLKNEDADGPIEKYTITQYPRRYVYKEKKLKKDVDPPTDFFKYQTGIFDGIMTLQYRERVTEPENCEGDKQQFTSPVTNCLQVFIGNVDTNYTGGDEKRIKENLDTFRENIVSLKRERQNILKEINKKDKEIDELKKKLKNLTKEIQNEGSNENNTSTNDETNKLNNSIDVAKSEREKLVKYLNIVETQLDEQQKNIRDTSLFSSATPEYRYAWQNYYYLHPILEWNIHYLTTMKLFDSKVVAAQLIEALTGCMTLDINVSVSNVKSLIKDEIENIIKSVIETDDAVVSDCFFSFSNEDYEKMLHKAELRKAGFFTVNGEENSNATLTAESVLSSLDNISDTSTKEEINTVIEGGLREISASLGGGDDSGKSKPDLDYEVSFNFIENLLTNLTYVITTTVLSPKVYLLIAINQQIVGEQPKGSLLTFMESHRRMLVDIIREIKDAIMEWLRGKVMEIVGDIAGLLQLKFANEQLDYYRDLLKKMFKCFQMHKGRENLKDFNIANVDYADIYGDDNTEESAAMEC